MVEVCDQSYYSSELLFSVDYSAYRDAGMGLCSGDEVAEGDSDEK
jgi:hypothetical protein